MTTTLDQTTTGALTKLLTFASKRAGIDPRDYGEGMDGYRAYRAESRAVTRDLHRVRHAASEAMALGVTDEEIVEASKHAFSGRLEWTGTDWDYCTGQYFPTEYRKAVATVLESAVSAKKQSMAHTVTVPRFETVADVKAYHQETGGHWFDRSTMRYFGTKIHTKGKLIHGKYFITSEQPPHGPRGYTVRCVSPDGDISTIGELCGYRSAQEAALAARIRG